MRALNGGVERGDGDEDERGVDGEAAEFFVRAETDGRVQAAPELDQQEQAGQRGRTLGRGQVEGEEEQEAELQGAGDCEEEVGDRDGLVFIRDGRVLPSQAGRAFRVTAV